LTSNNNLHMNKPIWVWVYDFGTITHPPFNSIDAERGPKIYPQAHTYAFTSEESAKKHPEAMGWSKDHSYILQKVYLND
jgi:hypothetical protein